MADPPRPGMTDKQARDWAMLVHLSALAGILVPLGNLLGPLVMWMIKKDESPFVDRHGKSAINFHISIMLYVVVAIVLMAVIAVATLGIGIILLIPVIILGALVLMVLVVVFPILGCLKAQNGEEYAYPLTIAFLK